MLPRIVSNYFAARRRHRLKGKELAEFQARNLHSLALHAYQNVPYYHDLFTKHKIDPDQVSGVDKLRLLPILTRQHVQDNYNPNRMLVSGTTREGTIIRRTSGTTGNPLEIVWDNEYCDINAALRLIMVRSLGVSIFDKTVEIQYHGPEATTPDAKQGSRMRKIFVGPMMTPILFTLRSRRIGFKRSITEIEEELLKLRPAAIYCRPSYLRRLGLHLDREGKRLRIPKILSGGEYLSGPVRKDIARLFDSDIFNNFGSQELGWLGMECREHSGIHLFSDYFVFEFLKDGEPASPGEEAELIVTSLYNKTMPLIRYKLGDIVVQDSTDECACGLGFPKLREIRGRPDDGLEAPDGTRIPVGPVVDYIETLGLRDYQLVQTSKNSVLVRLVQDQDTRKTTQELVPYIESLLGSDIRVEFDRWKEDDIPPKYKPVMRRFANAKVVPSESLMSVR